MLKQLSISLLACLSLLNTAIGQKVDMEKLKEIMPRSVGPAGMSGRVTAIDVVLSSPNVIYTGTASGGLWKSVSGGTHWEPVFDRESVSSIGAVAVNQSNPDVIWVGTGEGNPRNSLNHGGGVFRSPDGGRTWKLMGLEKTRNIHRIIIHPSNPDIVYVGAIGSPWGPHPERGLFKTADGGKTWDKILFTNELSGVADMVMDPINPDKLFVAMWEHRRWPWFFKSGGPGSGLYVTYNGGADWKKITEKDGLPAGEMGRMGLAVARNNPAVVYAIIEAKENALYRSNDGGQKWSKTGDRDIGDRPFYYAEIYVDPKNENRLYSLFSRVNISEDGGKSFTQLIGREIHPDHHAWWIHPENPKFMINGNDGGLAITYDQGKTWRFVENLPLGQFYHIRVDNELPYNIYGGLQDNGSWKGPAYTWSGGSIINAYWDNLMGGDGFDVLPDYSDPRYCYAMSQGGNLGRVDLLTGYSKSIRPVHPEGRDLRFHWNAAIAYDPFNPRTIFFASQFIHRSRDRGESWEIISPDLTTNDPVKQKYGESGGLTYDVTGAETHTTILCIAPSPVTEGVIWAGTDDGNLQLTTDGGRTWKNLTASLKDVPPNSWIPMIHPSGHHAGEAFVVVNNYRRNDWKPYLYHTTDYGKKWTRLADESKVQSFCLSVIQDPLEPRLLFLGTDDGLYLSVDYGQNWTRWAHGLPTVPVMDLAIQPREHDLVIGTFGRSVYVIDDIRPLRELAREPNLLDRTIHAFSPPEAYIVEYKNEPGLFSPGHAYFQGQNRPRGAMISFAVREGQERGEIQPETRRPDGRPSWGSGQEEGRTIPPGDQVKIRIYDQGENLVRTLAEVPVPGINRIRWNFDRTGYRLPGQPRIRPGSPERGGGPTVMPGTYKLVFEYKANKDSTSLTILTDPRMTFSAETMKNNQETLEPFMARLEMLAEAMDRISDARTAMDLVSKQLPEKQTDETRMLRELAKATTDSLNAITKTLEADRNIKGIYRDPKVISSDLYRLRSLMDIWEPLNPNQMTMLEQTRNKVDEALRQIDRFFDTQWKVYREAVEKAKLSPFRD